MKSKNDDITLIEKYLDYDLSREEQNLFKHKLNSSPAFVELFDLAKSTIENLQLEHAEGIKKEIYSIYKNSKEERLKKIKTRNRLLFAASTILILMFVFFGYKEYDQRYENLYLSYYELYPATPNPRGTTSSVKTGMDHYRNQNYLAALRLFSSDSVYEQEQLALYKGNCYLRLNQEKMAIESFKVGMNSEDEIIKNYSKWYLALAYIKNKQPSKAKEELLKILNRNKLFSEEAKSLLKQLKEQNL